MSGSKKAGVVYLYQFPRCTDGPNASPFCLKLELFLRMNKIPHEVIGTFTLGPKGKLPYIEVNGETVADSDFVVDFLIKKYGLTLNENLDALQVATGHALQQMLEENTFWSVGYHRAVENKFEGLAELFRPNPGIALKLFIRFATRNVKGSLRTQGIGRHSPDEVHQIVEKDLRSVSVVLGSKKYLFSESEPSAVDAAVFGQLATSYYHAPGSYNNKLMKGELSNLGQYVEHIRSEFFPDWDELSAK